MKYLAAALAVVASLSAASPPMHAEEPKASPLNVVVIIADDKYKER